MIQFEHKYAHLRACFTEANLKHGVAVKLAKYLINADIVSPTERGVLHHIAMVGENITDEMTTQKIDATDLLIAKGADIHQLYPAFEEAPLKHGYEAGVTPLAAATSRKDFKLVMHLLDRCAHPWYSDYSYANCAYDIAKGVEWERGVCLFKDWEQGYRGTQLGTEGRRPLHGRTSQRWAKDPSVVALRKLGKEHEKAM